MPNNPHGEGEILTVTKTDQYRTVKELFQRSQPNSSYYVMLVLSVLIITPGLLINNTAIVIGGMLVTPVLTPLLLIGLGLAVGEPEAIKNVAILMGKSFLLILAGSIAMAALFGAPSDVFSLTATSQTIIAYFIVALASGVAGALAFSKKELSDVLPGIAISVSLVPPLSLIGIWLSALNFVLARFYLVVFLLNLAGIILGSLVVFALLKFHKAERKIKQTAKNEEQANGNKA